MQELTPRRRESDRPRGKLRKGMYILPSLFTTANIAAGFYAILQTVYGSAGEAWHMDFAAKAIGFAVLFDGLDGRIARMTHTDSDFGRELDSLADVITFGMAPSLLAFVWGFHFLPDSMNAQLQMHLMQAGAGHVDLGRELVGTQHVVRLQIVTVSEMAFAQHPLKLDGLQRRLVPV